MPDHLPEPLKIPEISRFVKRADQLRSIKPAVAYWCEYHAVNQIVARNLHTTDDDCFAFTRILLERLESTKAERADDDAIVDNTAGQAYVEQFAQQTFDRAERTLRANKVTRQTADTFDAAATFFDLSNVWGPPEAESLQKIKFAKWNATRILKALREGVDPNESNPKPAEPEQELHGEVGAGFELDPNDPDVQQITGAPGPPQPASVVDAQDAGEQYVAPAVISPPHDQSAQQPPHPSPGVHEGYFPPAPSSQPHGSQPQPFPTSGSAADPFVPSPMSGSPATASSGMPPPSLNTTGPPNHPPPQLSPPGPSPGMNQSGPPSWTTTPSVPHPASSNPPPAMPHPSAPSYSAAPPPHPYQQAPPPAAVPPPMMPVHSVPIPPSTQQDVNKAQKHAKFAISALNFDDVPTAIKELRTALASLGVQT